MYIEELIPDVNLETTNIEFKGIIEDGQTIEGKSKDIGWLKTIAAFANTSGGNLYIGVDNNTHKILSLDHDTADKVSQLIHRKIRERVDPIPKYDITPILVKGDKQTRYVLCITVKQSTELPVIIHEKGLLGIYVRNFGQTVTATPEQVRELILMSENVPYDRPFTMEKFDKNNYKKLYNYVSEQNETINEKALMSIGFISNDKYLSKGAILFSDNYSGYDTKAVATVWPGHTKGSSIVTATEEYTGNLLEIIEKSIQFVKNHSNNGFIKEATGRSDYISYPARSVTEGIVNAVGHRNYFIQGSQIEINIFKDRLEITSPGSLLGVRELKKEKNIASIIPRRRNEVICAVLELCNYMEEKGSGFDKIEADYSGFDEKYRPYISSDSSSFTLTLPDLTWQGSLNENTDILPDVYTDSLLTGKNDLHILAFCFETPRTVKEIATELGVTPSNYLRKDILAKLIDKDLLITQSGTSSILYKSNPKRVFIK